MANKIKIYEIANPYWLSDTFVFAKKRMNGMELVCYIKVNHDDKIEEIGCDFEGRFHNAKYDEVITREKCIEATQGHKMRFNVIDDEHWLSVYDMYKRLESPWKRVSRELPIQRMTLQKVPIDLSDEVIVRDVFGKTWIARYDFKQKRWWGDNQVIIDVVSWMEIPN